MTSFSLGSYRTGQTPYARGSYFTKKTWLPREALEAWFSLGPWRTLWSYKSTFSFGSRETNSTWRAHGTWDSR